MNISPKLALFTSFCMKHTFDTIYYILYKGLVDLDLRRNSVILKNHLIFSYAFSEFYKRYQKGG